MLSHAELVEQIDGITSSNRRKVGDKVFYIYDHDGILYIFTEDELLFVKRNVRTYRIKRDAILIFYDRDYISCFSMKKGDLVWTVEFTEYRIYESCVLLVGKRIGTDGTISKSKSLVLEFHTYRALYKFDSELEHGLNEDATLLYILDDKGIHILNLSIAGLVGELYWYLYFTKVYSVIGWFGTFLVYYSGKDIIKIYDYSTKDFVPRTLYVKPGYKVYRSTENFFFIIDTGEFVFRVDVRTGLLYAYSE